MSEFQESRYTSGVMSPVYAKYIAERPPLPPFSGNPVEFRPIRAQHLAGLRHLMPLGGKPIPEVKERDIYVTVRDGYPVRVRIYHPASGRTLDGGGPLVLMFHEGGFMFGDLTDEEMNCRLFAREFGAVCGNVEYRLGPEHQFPRWIEDCWDVTKWFSENSRTVGAAPAKGFIVGGASAGGNIAAVLAQLSRLEGLSSPITGQFLMVPVIFDMDIPPEKYKDEYRSRWMTGDPVLNGDAAAGIKGPLKLDHNSIMFTPLASPGYPPSASSTSRRMAPAYMQIAGLDPLRDHGLIYDKILREEYGTQSRVDLYEGFGHMFWTNWPEMKESHDFVDDTVRGVRWLLEQKPT